MSSQLKIVLQILLCGCLLLQSTSWAKTDAQLKSSIEYLKQLELEELLNTEVTLDQVFDVFDGVIEVRKVSVASGNVENVAMAPAVTTVITAQDIEATAAKNLDEVLHTVPGLYVARAAVGERPVYIMRGANATIENPEILFLINGVPYKRLVNGGRSSLWQNFPVQAIARIEVIRGPGSALYGADALSGVINIITKTAVDIDSLEISARVGSFDSQTVAMLYGNNKAPIKTAFSLEYSDTDGHQEIITADAQTLQDRIAGTQASLAPSAGYNQKRSLFSRLDMSYQQWHLHLAYWGLRDAGTGAGAADALDPIGHYAGHNWRLDLNWQTPHVIKGWQIHSHLNLEYNTLTFDDFHSFPAGTAIGGTVYPEGIFFDLTTQEENARVGLQADYTGFKHHHILVGAGYNYEDMHEVTYRTNFGLDGQGQLIPPSVNPVDLTDTPFSFTPELIRKSWYVFLQESWRLTEGWELTLGVRHDDYSDFGSTTNPRAALVWQTTPHLTSKLLYGEAFRAPSFAELYALFSVIGQGNPNLSPEESETWELAFDWQARRYLNLAFNIYRYRFSDRIQPVMGDALTQLPLLQNQATWKGRGLEFEGRWKMGTRSSLLFNYAYTRTESSNIDVGNYPQQQAYIRYDQLVMRNWYLNTQLNWVANRQRPIDDLRSTSIADYQTVDLTLRYKNIRKQRWNVAFGIRNALDEDVRHPAGWEIPNDLPQAGRNYFLEVRYRH